MLIIKILSYTKFFIYKNIKIAILSNTFFYEKLIVSNFDFKNSFISIF